MAKPLTSEHLRALAESYSKMADELDDAEKAEDDASSRAELKAALDEQKSLKADMAKLRKVFVERGIDPDALDDDGAGDSTAGDDGGDGAGDADGKGEDGKPAPRTRPGRKSGAAYDWTVDDNGQVVELGLAEIYSGEDEPDEVELPEADAA